jgi:hypothetical protein
MNKYHNKPTIINGRRFASKREAKRYAELLFLQDHGNICDLQRQVPFTLFALGGGPVGRYIADFIYFDTYTQKEVIEDAKGFRTALYRWKKKHFELQYGKKIVEV